MKVKHFSDTDTLYIELHQAEVDETLDLDEDTVLELDAAGRLCAITIKHASDRIDVSSLKTAPSGAKSGLNLTTNEQGWLDEYRRQLQDKFPGLVEDVLIYGPYARGVSDPDVEMDVLVLIREGDRKRKEEVNYLGHTIDMDGFFVAPSIMVYAKAEWVKGNPNVSWIYESVTREGVSVI